MSFWSTQPVPQTKKDLNEPNPTKPPNQNQNPTTLPPGYEWCTCDITSPTQLDEIYMLLKDQYVEDGSGKFRLCYTKDFLRWALQPPHYIQDLYLGLKVMGVLVGFICAIPINISVRGTTLHVAEINFLCVRKELRNHKLAPLLITEITRRAHTHHIFQAIYTAGVELPTPFGVCKYYHRLLDVKKLVDAGFTSLNSRMTIPRATKLYQLPSQTPLKPLEKKDCDQARILLQAHLSTFQIYPIFTPEEFEHWFLPRPGVVYSYVDEGMTTFGSFYSLPLSVLQQNKQLPISYLWYTTPNTTKDLLILAKKEGFAAFNAMDNLHTAVQLKELKFEPGTGVLNYYLFGWRAGEFKPEEVGVILF